VPGDRVINSGYCYWHVIDSVSHCVLISVTRPTDSSTILSNLHIATTLIRTPPHFWAIVTFVADLTVSAVNQWVGYLYVGCTIEKLKTGGVKFRQKVLVKLLTGVDYMPFE
jgi:hypothetical protein